MHTIFFDDDLWNQLKPLTLTRPACELRVGIMTIREKWEKVLGSEGSHFTKSYLKEKYPVRWEEQNLLINGAALPNPTLAGQVSKLKLGEAVVQNDRIIAAVLNETTWGEARCGAHEDILKKYEPAEEIKFVEFPHNIFTYNFEEIEKDYRLITDGRTSQPLSHSVSVLGHASNAEGKPMIFLEKGAVVEHAILNVTNGPVYIGKDATIQEGSMVRGPFALCEHAQINMGAKVYGGTTLGPWSKAGGELNNVVFTGYSNKGHDGFLGNAVLGEWCNLGADTNNSNLKNNYSSVKMWSYKERRFIPTGLQFCGLIMGDHTKTGINTMFNTGTVTGVCSNIFGPGFPRTFIPSFVQGGPQGYRTVLLKWAYDTAELVMQRRGVEFTNVDKRILEHVFEDNESFRKIT